jgi:uncharacterized protein (DUF608 family)
LKKGVRETWSWPRAGFDFQITGSPDHKITRFLFEIKNFTADFADDAD